MPTYCGNNMNDNRLISGTHILGSNYQCLRKGIFVGRHLPYDNAYTQPYVPVDARKFYCGNNPVLPQGGGHFAIGSPSKCLQIGVGVGKVQRVAMGPPVAMYFIRFILPYLLFFLITGVIFFILKIKLVKKDSSRTKYVTDWDKFIPYYLLSCIIVAVIIWWFWNRYVRRWV